MEAFKIVIFCRKRSSETSMYITDTVPLDTTTTTTTHQKLKKPKRIKSNEEQLVQKQNEARRIEFENKKLCENESMMEESVNDVTKERKNDVSNDKQSEEEEINDLANSILEDDDDFEEDLFAMDTENQSNRESRIGKKNRIESADLVDKSRISETILKDDSVTRGNEKISNECENAMDKSRIVESQFTNMKDDGSNVVNSVDMKSFQLERSRVSDSQPIEETLCDNQEMISKTTDRENMENIKKYDRFGMDDENLNGNICRDDSMILPLGFRNSKREKVILIDWLIN